MSSASSVALGSTSNAEPKIVRRSANYMPSIWGDRFLEYDYDKMALNTCSEQVEELKGEVRQMLTANATKAPSSQMMRLIDTLQRLGIAYHFETEIDKALEQVFNDNNYYDIDDLYTISLHFRLLRQQGYNVSCDVFGKYKDAKGNFTENLTNDVPGMLSLYEATHLRIHGEEILDDALGFTSYQLMSVVNHLSSPLAEQVDHALRQPLHKGMPRLEARHYISIYQEDNKHNKRLLQFAKLDFNQLQSLHLKELSEVSKWWKGLQFASKLPFARDRLVECYFWILGVYFEPRYSFGRVTMTKIIAMTSVIDDIYDVYGTIEELSLFTNAIERWDIYAIDELPGYMKVVYLALVDLYNETEDEMAKEGRSYCVHYAKELMKELSKAYFVEAKWFNKGYIPTVEEYMDNALITSAYAMLTVTSFIGMGDIVPKETLDWVKNGVIPTRASSIICRLMDDIVSHKFEQERGHVASAIECYMKQYNVLEQEAYDVFKRRVDQAWKDLNKGCLKPTVVPKPLLERTINLTRMIDVMYKHKDGYTDSHVMLKEYITSVLDPISM